MGNFLDTPITEKETAVDRDGKVAYGLSAMQGWRAQMEDDHVQLLSLSQEVSQPCAAPLLLPSRVATVRRTVHGRARNGGTG